MKTERKLYLDYLRIAALLAVLLMHSASKCVSNISPNQIQWLICQGLSSLTRWAVPMFVMISGALMLGKQEIHIRTIFTKNVLRLATAYFFWSFIYTLCFSTIPYYDIFSFSAVNNTIWGTIKGGYYHLWFMPMIISLYFMLPILRPMVRESQNWTMCYWMAFGTAIIFIWPIFSRVPLIKDNFGPVIAPFSSNFFSVYVFYFLLGYALDRIHLNRSRLIICYTLGIIGAISTAISVILPALYSNTESKDFLMSDSLNILFMSAGLFVASKNICTRTDKKPNNIVFVAKLSKYTFGVYLIHELIMSVVDSFFLKYMQPITSMICLFAVTVVVGFFLIAILAKIKWLSKYIL